MRYLNRVPLPSEFSFIHVADIHVGTPRSFRFAPAWNDNWETARNQIVELDPDFLLVGGDMTRDGSTHRFELEQIRNDLDGIVFSKIQRQLIRRAFQTLAAASV